MVVLLCCYICSAKRMYFILGNQNKVMTSFLSCQVDAEVMVVCLEGGKFNSKWIKPMRIWKILPQFHIHRCVRNFGWF